MLATLRDRLNARPPAAFFSQAKPEPAPRRRYLIATSARTGSTLLCSRIAEYGQLGFPMEFLNESYIAEFDRLFPNLNLQDFEGFVQSRFASSRSGVFGLKTDWWHFREARELGLFESFFSPLDLLVHLTREDFVDQAVSLALAVNTGVWHLRDAFTNAESAHATQAYDQREIKRHIRNILNQEYHWRQFYKGLETPVIETTYEQLVRDMDDTIGQIAAAFDLRLPPKRNVPPATERTRTRVAAEWADRFREECEDFVGFWREYRGLATAA